MPPCFSTIANNKRSHHLDRVSQHSVCPSYSCRHIGQNMYQVHLEPYPPLYSQLTLLIITIKTLFQLYWSTLSYVSPYRSILGQILKQIALVQIQHYYFDPCPLWPSLFIGRRSTCIERFASLLCICPKHLKHTYPSQQVQIILKNM